ncbi:MAG TPA: DUF3131 domain-containing protein [Saprospiraceae bacterium]|nr:DUF3131 domain-containing protein [Saprospiraceae bacterium]
MQIIINTDKFVKTLKYLLKPIIMLVAIYAGANAVLFIEKARPSDFGFYKDIFSKELIIKPSVNYPLRKYGDSLSKKDIEYATIAWTYFKNNYQETTGLFNSVDKYPATTLWDISSSFHALMSAYEIGIIDSIEFNSKLSKALTSIEKMKLYKDELPNKVYSTYSLDMVDYSNYATTEGIGWSAMDIGRIFGVFYRIKNHYPNYVLQVNNIIAKWNIKKVLTNDATLHGIGFNFKDKRVKIVQEGKLGYEEYASKGYILNNFDATESYKYTDFLKFVDIYGIQIGTDTREVKQHPSYNYILSEPYILDGIEYGWDINSKELAYRVYQVQKKRAKMKKKLIAVSEDHVDAAPYFVYNSIYNNGEKWVCIAENGDNADDYKNFSTKAAYAWSTLYNDKYSTKLHNALEGLYNKEKGWYAGRYDKSNKLNKALTANTNAVILECINYKMKGPLLKITQ